MPSIIERWNLFKRPAVINVSISGDASAQVLNLDAKKLYQTQDNLRAVVDFLSNSIAQLPLKVYVRDGETERKRDRDSDAAKLIYRPNEDQTEFEFIRALAIEYFVFGSVYIWVLPDVNSESGYQLRIVPQEWIVQSTAENAYSPDVIRICTKNGGTAVDVPRTEFVQFKTYSAGNPGGYLSPISALKQTLCEQVESGRFRRQLWRSSGRLNAQIIRPKDVAVWDEKARTRFIESFREAWGAGGSKAGSIPLMEDGMEIKPFQTSFKESEWAQSVKLSRESVAAAYGVNPSLIWHSETQTYASSKDNARALYAECLGPVIQMLQQRINAFLLPKVNADPRTYVEFDLSEKLKGSFEERASILQTSVGAPWLTRNEARADMNLPPVDGGDALITPLNVEAGSNSDFEEDSFSKKLTCSCKSHKQDEEVRIKGISDKEDDEKVTDVLQKFFERQSRSVLPKIGAGDDWWNQERWDKELAEDLEPVLTEIADKHGKEAA
ncbi:MAG: phage portal protein, partial [Verrucomicrobia bacterium]|nr:phage portal protein [Verrucomicrobiota bacterium]